MKLTANIEERTITGLMLPFGEVGQTNLGKVTASAGTVALPENLSTITLNMEHSATAPVGRATAIEETDDGLVATFKVARTRAGDDLLAEVAEELRTGLSVELDAPVIRAGQLISATLTACAAVVNPAFTSARVMTASDCGDLEDTSAATETPVLVAAEAINPIPSEATANDTTNQGTESFVDNATAPAELLLASSKNGVQTDKAVSLRDLTTMVATAHNSGRPESLTAALTDVTETVFDNARQPQYLGELWDGREAPTFYTGLIGSATLTSRKAVGWKYSTKPTVGDWDGFPDAIHSSTISVELIEVVAQRMAGGATFDRSLVDFGETAYIDAYFRFCTNDYVQKLDQKVLTTLSAAATAATAAAGTVASGTDVASSKIVDGVLHLLSENVVPSFAVIGQDLFRDYLLTPKDKTLEYFSGVAGFEQSGLAGLTVVPSSNPAHNGKVFVGAKEAFTLFQLPGTPVRVDALDVSRGGVEGAIYGYYAILYTGRGIVSVV